VIYLNLPLSEGMLYIAIIGDIVNSKKIADRCKVQKQLAETLNIVNQKYKDDIASKFMITLGDEFQGLLKCGRNTINIIQEIERKLHPIKIRFGIGIGKISTPINPDMPLGADGPAYHNARRMIDELKKLEKKNMTSAGNIRICIDKLKELEILINSILSLCSVLKSKWTNRQAEIIYDFLEHKDSQTNTAKRLGIAQSSVNKVLSAANFYTYKNSLETIAKILEEIKVK